MIAPHVAHQSECPQTPYGVGCLHGRAEPCAARELPPRFLRSIFFFDFIVSFPLHRCRRRQSVSLGR